MTNDTKTRYIPVPQWAEYYPWPSVTGLRALIQYRAKNGFDKAVVKIGKRVLIDEQQFLLWVEKRNKFNFGFRKPL